MSPEPIKFPDFAPDFDFSKFPAAKVIGIGVPALLLAIAAWTAVYTVPAESEGVVLRFGRFIDTAPSGLHFKIPLGVDRVVIVPVKRQLKQEFGFGSRHRQYQFRSDAFTYSPFPDNDFVSKAAQA